jgi:hypothetical protein
MTNIENTCLLGNDFPEVSFLIADGTPNTSYGLGALNFFLNKLNATNDIPGTRTALNSPESILHSNITRKIGYATYISIVSTLSM